MPTRQHQRLIRRAPPRSSSENDVTVPVEEETTTSRRRTTRTRATAPETSAPEPNTTPATTSRSVVNNSATLALSSIATSAVIKVPTPSSSSSSSSISSSASGITTGNAAATVAGNSSSSSTTLIAAVVAAVAAVILIAGLIFFFVRRRQRRLNTVDAGYRKNGEKEDDDRSFVGGMAGNATLEGAYPNEKNYGAFNDQQDYGMKDMNGNQDQPWSQNPSQLSYVHTPPPPNGHHSYDSIDGMANSQLPQDYNNGYPPNKPVTNGFMSPPPGMLPTNSSNTTTPYAAAKQQAAPPPVIIQPAAEQEGPFADPQWANKLFKVTRTFQPNMPDELIIKAGDRIKILMAYDDGWCLGENLDSVPSVTQGVFPKDCVEEIGLNEVPLATAGSFNSTPLNSGAESPSKQQGLTRAPTLPPIDVSNDKNYRDSHIADSYFGNTHNTNSPTKNNKHTSSGSTQSLNHRSSMIDYFPTPNAQPVKRASSLIASKDANLFMALGAALNTTDSKQ